MRIGWVRAAPDVIRSLVAARAYADLGTPVLEQLAVNWLMRTGGWEQAVEIRREQARENRDDLVRALRRELPGVGVRGARRRPHPVGAQRRPLRVPAGRGG